MLKRHGIKLTQVSDAVTGLVERPGIELEADNGEDQDGEHDEQADLWVCDQN